MAENFDAAKPTAGDAGWSTEDFRSYVLDEARDVAHVRGQRLGKLRAAIPPSLKPKVRAAATRSLVPLSRRKIARAAAAGPVRLYLGCGSYRKPGWVNIDLVGAQADIFWDLSTGIPFPDGSAVAVFHEHLYEHLPIGLGYALAVESRRVLQPGGVLRIGVPDAGACLDSYSGRTDPSWAQSRPTPMLAVTALFYEHGHLAMYDAETLCQLCLAAGFDEATVGDFGTGHIGPEAVTPERRDNTLYVEAIRR